MAWKLAMWLMGVVALVAAVAACSTAGRITPFGPHDPEGYTVAGHLQERYDNPLRDCQLLPAVLCVGVLGRTVVRGPGFYVWNPNPASKTPNGVSFFFMHKGAAFGRMPWGYGDGYIILPYFYADAPSDGYTQLTVLCMFAFDGATDNRTGADSQGTGCGSHNSAPASTGPCQAQGVTNANQWIAKFGNSTNRYVNNCGFNIRPGVSDAGRAFQSIYGIRQSYSTGADFQLHTEVEVGTWAQNDCRLPLEAFFYVVNTTGLASAKLNQQDFWNACSRWVPVISITMPGSVSGPASFMYRPDDQQIP